MKIAFLISAAALSGGNYVIFQHALWAHQNGHDATIVTLSTDSPYRNVWHPAIEILTFKHIADVANIEFDVAISTYWRTALELHQIKSRQYINFIQSIESKFYTEDAVAIRKLIESIYALNLPVVTEASWIKEYLESNHGSRCELVRNGVRKNLYKVDGDAVSPREAGKLRVLVEGPFGRIKNTARAMSTARRAGAHEIWLLTTSDIPWYPHTNRIFSNLPIDKVPPIYRSCDAIIKLSLVEGMFGPPLEMFHCGGTAVVYDVTGHDEYIIDKENALVVSMHDEKAVIESIRRLRDDPDLLNTLKSGALETAAQWPSWDESSRQFMSALERLYETGRYTQEQLIFESNRLRKTYSDQMIDLPQHGSSSTSTWRTRLSAIRHSARRYRTFFNNIIDSYR